MKSLLKQFTAIFKERTMTIPKYFKAKIALDKNGRKIGFITDVRVASPETKVTISVSKKPPAMKYPSMGFSPDSMIKYTEKKIWFDITKKEAHKILNDLYDKLQLSIKNTD